MCCGYRGNVIGVRAGRRFDVPHRSRKSAVLAQFLRLRRAKLLPSSAGVSYPTTCPSSSLAWGMNRRDICCGLQITSSGRPLPGTREDRWGRDLSTDYNRQPSASSLRKIRVEYVPASYAIAKPSSSLSKARMKNNWIFWEWSSTQRVYRNPCLRCVRGTTLDHTLERI